MIESPEAVVVGTVQGVAGNFEVHVGDMLLAVSAPIHYYAEDQKRPKKHQLLVEFETAQPSPPVPRCGAASPTTTSPRRAPRR